MNNFQYFISSKIFKTIFEYGNIEHEIHFNPKI